MGEICKVIEKNFEKEHQKFCKQPHNLSKSEEELIGLFLDTIKTRFAEHLALHIIEQELKVPDKIRNLIDKAVEEVKNE